MFVRASRWVMVVGLSSLCGCAETAYSRPGFQLGVGPAVAIDDFDVHKIEAATGSHVTVRPSAAADGHFGYRFHPNFALDGDAQYYHEFEYRTQGHELGEVRGWEATANLKWYFATGPVQPYALAGFGALHLDSHHTLGFGQDLDETELVGRFGGGFDFYLDDHVVLYAEGAYNVPGNRLDDFRYTAVSAGLLYRF